MLDRLHKMVMRKLWHASIGFTKYFSVGQTAPGAHPAPCAMGTGSFPRVKNGRGVTLTPHPLLMPLVMKE